MDEEGRDNSIERPELHSSEDDLMVDQRVEIESQYGNLGVTVCAWNESHERVR